MSNPEVMGVSKKGKMLKEIEALTGHVSGFWAEYYSLPPEGAPACRDFTEQNFTRHFGELRYMQSRQRDEAEANTEMDVSFGTAEEETNAQVSQSISVAHGRGSIATF